MSSEAADHDRLGAMICGLMKGKMLSVHVVGPIRVVLASQNSNKKTYVFTIKEAKFFDGNRIRFSGYIGDEKTYFMNISDSCLSSLQFL